MLSKLKHIIRKKATRSIGKYDVTKEQLYQMQKEGAKIIDVRSPQEYREGHIQGAMLLPEYELDLRINGLLENKNDTIVLYCSSGIRSKRMQKDLQKMGFKKVFNLYNGLENY